MEKAQFAAESIAAEFLQNIEGKELPKIIWKCSSNKEGENYVSSYAGGTITLTANNPLSAAFGLSQLLVGVLSGHLSDFLGERQPRWTLRPLWIQQEHDISNPDLFCRRIIELGYNAVLLSHSGSLGKALKEHGLKVILTLPNNDHPSPLHPLYKQNVRSNLAKAKDADFIFLESRCCHPEFFAHPSSQDYVEEELVALEAKTAEEALSANQRLIFYVPADSVASAKKQALWLPRLCDDVGNKTVIAFSATAGDPVSDHLSPHPFWDILRKTIRHSATPLLPIVNIGGIKQGDGLWPSVAIDLIEKYYSRCESSPFAGVIALTKHVPRRGGMLDCSLWAAAQYLWKPASPTLLAETWFSANRFDFSLSSLRHVREIITGLSYLRSLDTLPHDECRVVAESIVALLKREQVCGNKQGYSDYLPYFIRDVRRLLFHCLQNRNIPMAGVLAGDDFQESFWAGATSLGQGFRGGAEVTVYQDPKRGAPGSEMEKIFLANRLF